MIGVLETISFGISVIKEGKSLYDALTGNTLAGDNALAQDFDKLRTEVQDLKKVTERLAITDLQEVHRHAGQTEIIRDVRSLHTSMEVVQQSIGTDLIQSQPIRTPEKLRNVFEENPERLLMNIRPLAGFDIANAVPEDRTLLPVVFERYGVHFVGWMKTGVLSLTLDTDYEPAVMRQLRGGTALPGITATSRPPARAAAPADSGASPPERIAGASPGATIELLPGVYEGPLRIDKPITLVGVGDPNQIIIEATDAEVVTWFASEGRITNLTLRQTGSRDMDCLWFSPGASGTLDGCILTGTGVAVIVVEADADPLIRANAIHGSAGSGIVVRGGAKGRIEHNDIFGHAYAGIAVRGGAHPIVENNRIFDNSGDGIEVTEDARGIIETNEIHGNAFAGIAIAKGADPTVRGNTIRDGRGDGILVHEAGKGLIEKNQIVANAASGIAVRDGSEPVIEGNTIRDGKGDGVLFAATAKGSLVGNEISGSGYAGVAVTSGADPFVEDNVIRDGHGDGVYVTDDGRGVFSGNTITGNRSAGLVTTNGGDPNVSNNAIQRNGGDGVWIQAGGRGFFEANDLRGNAHGAVHQDDGAGGARFSGNVE